jgi:hypothetical protein
MIAQAVILICVAAIVYLLVLRHKRSRTRTLEETARLRAIRRWREVLDEEADPSESFVEYQARRTGPAAMPRATADHRAR